MNSLRSALTARLASQQNTIRTKGKHGYELANNKMPYIGPDFSWKANVRFHLVTFLKMRVGDNALVDCSQYSDKVEPMQNSLNFL